MPPKSKCTRDQIISTAFEMVRKEGRDALTARNLAKALGTFTAPIFTSFSSIEEIQNEVIDRAKALYGRYVQEGLQQSPAFKGVGLKYIEFAQNEPELFQILFASNAREHSMEPFLPSYDENAPLILNVLQGSYGLSSETARRLYNHMSVYAFGFASLYAQRIYMFSMEDIGRMLSEVFTALIKNETDAGKIPPDFSTRTGSAPTES